MTWQPDYITTAALKAFLRIGDTVDDTEIALYVTGASRAIDDHCNRQFGRLDAAAALTYRAWYDRDRCCWAVTIDDLMSTDDLVVTVAGTTVALDTDFRLLPSNAAALGRPWTRLEFTDDSAIFPTGVADEVSITERFGWLAVPSPVQLAARIQAARFSVRRDSPFGVAGSPTDGSEMRLLARLDPDVAVGLRGFRRPRAAL